MFSSSAIKNVGNAKIDHQLAITEKNLTDISLRLSKLHTDSRCSVDSTLTSKTIINQHVVSADSTHEVAVPDKAAEWDWTKSYSSWNSWEDIDDLYNIKRKEEMKWESIQSKRDLLAHNHDHSKEREFYELADEKKFQTCEDHRYLGNHLFHEGWFAKALEHYHIALGYYEYCFPNDVNQQKELDRLRFICLCNMSLCCIHLGFYRRAIESSTVVLRECSDRVICSKALFRRGQAYRFLDEYDLALADLQAANEMVPSNVSIASEAQLVRRLCSSYARSRQEFAKAILDSQNEHTSLSSGVAAISPLLDAINLHTMSMAIYRAANTKI